MVFLGRVLAVVLVALWLWPTGLHAQSAELDAAFRQGKALLEAGRYEQAIPYYRKALELGEQEFGLDHPTTATLLNNLAALYQAQGRYGDAEPLYKRFLAIVEKALGPDHPHVATSFAALLRETGRATEATEMEARAKAIRAKHAKQNP